VKTALIGAGQITGRHFSCLKALSGVQDAGSGILVREAKFEANDASQRITSGSS
jgi:hypothetical protein